MMENEEKVPTKRKIRFEYKYAPDFKRVYVTGARGGPTPYHYRIDFYREDARPPIAEEVSDEKHRKEIYDTKEGFVTIDREFVVGVTLSFRTARELRDWLQRHLEGLEEKLKQSKEEE